MAVRGINKVILVEDAWERIRKSVTSPTGAQWQTCRWPRQKAGVTNRRGRCGSRQNGIAWCCSASSRKWQVNVCARARRSTSKVSFAPVAREDNGITRYVTEILVKATGTMQMLVRARQVLNSAGRGATVQRSADRNHRRRPVQKRWRKRKAVDVRPRSRSLSRNRRRVTITGFQTISVLND